MVTFTNQSVIICQNISAWMSDNTLAGNFSHNRRLSYTTLFLWSSGHWLWLQIQRSRLRFLALPDFLRSRVSGTGSTQPHGDNWEATWMKNYRLRSRRPRLTVVGIHCADHATPSTRKGWQLRRRAAVARSVGIVRLRTTATEFSLVLVL
jgi:hypothetical protein